MTRAVFFAIFWMVAALPAVGEPFPELRHRIKGVEAVTTAAGGLNFQLDEEDCGVRLPRLLLCGEIAETTLTTQACKGSQGEFYDFWFFPAYRGDVIAAGTSTNAFAALLALFTPSPASLYDFDSTEPGELAIVSALIPRTGIWALSAGSHPSSVNKTGRYRQLLVCGTSSRCTPSPINLCLGGGRYRVQAAYRNQFSNTFGFAAAVPTKGTESGYFVFGDDRSNIELLVKLLDFGGGSRKVFWGQLTNLDYKIVVTDLATDRSETYFSQPANCGGSDADAFADLAMAEGTEAACRSEKGTACLLRGRFEVSGTWRNQYNGTTGEMGAARVSDLTGAFYFGSASNTELLVKFADLGSKIGFFYGAMSDLEYTLNVKDTVTGEVRTYHNPAGRYCGGLADLPR